MFRRPAEVGLSCKSSEAAARRRAASNRSRDSRSIAWASSARKSMWQSEDAVSRCCGRMAKCEHSHCPSQRVGVAPAGERTVAEMSSICQQSCACYFKTAYALTNTCARNMTRNALADLRKPKSITVLPAIGSAGRNFPRNCAYGACPDVEPAALPRHVLAACMV